MSRFPLSRAGLLTLIAGTHLALLWGLHAGLNQPPVQLPEPYPMVMAQMLPAPRLAPEPVPQPKPVSKPEVVKPGKPAPAPKQKPAPKQVPTPAVKPPPSEQAITAPPKPAPASNAAPEAPEARSTSAPAPAPSAAPASEPVTAPRFDAAYLNNPAPAYPPIARRMGEEGRVLLRVHVTPEGTAGDVRLHASSGSPQLDQAAIAAVRKWRFVPARQSGAPVAAWVQVPVSFTLD